MQQCPEWFKSYGLKIVNFVLAVDVKNVDVLGTCNGSVDLYKKVHAFH